MLLFLKIQLFFLIFTTIEDFAYRGWLIHPSFLYLTLIFESFQVPNTWYRWYEKSCNLECSLLVSLISIITCSLILFQSSDQSSNRNHLMFFTIMSHYICHVQENRLINWRTCRNSLLRRIPFFLISIWFTIHHDFWAGLIFHLAYNFSCVTIIQCLRLYYPVIWTKISPYITFDIQPNYLFISINE